MRTVLRTAMCVFRHAQRSAGRRLRSEGVRVPKTHAVSRSSRVLVVFNLYVSIQNVSILFWFLCVCVCVCVRVQLSLSRARARAVCSVCGCVRVCGGVRTRRTAIGWAAAAAAGCCGGDGSVWLLADSPFATECQRILARRAGTDHRWTLRAQCCQRNRSDLLLAECRFGCMQRC